MEVRDAHFTVEMDGSRALYTIHVAGTYCPATDLVFEQLERWLLTLEEVGRPYLTPLDENVAEWIAWVRSIEGARFRLFSVGHYNGAGEPREFCAEFRV